VNVPAVEKNNEPKISKTSKYLISTFINRPCATFEVFIHNPRVSKTDAPKAFA
jgi:hypothetical protein